MLPGQLARAHFVMNQWSNWDRTDHNTKPVAYNNLEQVYKLRLEPVTDIHYAS